MTIQKAIASGKPFRRIKWRKRYDEWYVTKKGQENIPNRIFWIGCILVGLTDEGVKEWIKNMEATDWEIKK